MGHALGTSTACHPGFQSFMVKSRICNTDIANQFPVNANERWFFPRIAPSCAQLKGATQGGRMIADSEKIFNREWTRMNANRLLKNSAASWVSEKYQVSGFQVSGLGIKIQEWPVILELGTWHLKLRHRWRFSSFA
jgi:hypothetical protein